MNEIRVFRDEHEFLSNYARALFRVNGILYPSVEHGFASFKTTDLALREAIAHLPGPGYARAVGRSRRPINGQFLVLRADWESIKDEVMLRLVYAKFAQNGGLRKQLLSTGNAALYEGTAPHVTGHVDTYWGIDLRTGEGLNHLGRILMAVRARLRREALVPA